MMEPVTHYGFIGLGSMGSAMAAHLADLCYSGSDEFAVWNRTGGRDAALREKGAIAAGSAAELVAWADVVIVMLPDLDQLIELTDGPAQLLAAVHSPTVLAVCSSVSPAGVRAYADRAAELTSGLLGVVDAPVSGGTEGAAAGTLAQADLSLRFFESVVGAGFGDQDVSVVHALIRERARPADQRTPWPSQPSIPGEPQHE